VVSRRARVSRRHTPASHLTANRDSHLQRRATLLNNGAATPYSRDLSPSEHGDQGRYLRLTKLPVNAHANTVLVAKLEFDHLPAVLGPVKESGASIL
jgi:hypothetical protein